MTLNDKARAAAKRRYAAIKSTPESDDLFWATTCKAWVEREYNAAAILLETAKILRSGKRLPSPLANWLADAIEAAMPKPPEHRARALLIELGLKHEGKPKKRLPDSRLLRGERANSGISISTLAKKYGVKKTTMADRLNEDKTPPLEKKALLRGAKRVQSSIKIPVRKSPRSFRTNG